ncbi:MAG: hypothetical protein QW035_03920 [Candidatus Anstonellales archaeon]
MEVKEKAVAYFKAWYNSKKGFNYPIFVERLNSFAKEPSILISYHRPTDHPDSLRAIKGPYFSILTSFLIPKISFFLLVPYFSYLKDKTLPDGINAHLFISNSPLHTSLRAYNPELIASFYSDWQKVEELRKFVMLNLNSSKGPTELCLLAFKKPTL